MARTVTAEAEAYRYACLRMATPYDERWCCCAEWFDYWDESVPVADGPHAVRSEGCKYEQGRDAERSAGKGGWPVTEAGLRGVDTPPTAPQEQA